MSERPNALFPATRPSIVAAVRSRDAETQTRAYGALVEAYWRPVYAYLRLRWRFGEEDARDLTQGFFARALEKGFFERYDPRRALFRTFLRVCLDRFAATERRADRRLKRGGGVHLVPFEVEGAEGELRSRDVAAAGSPDDVFRREWVRALFGLAVADVRAWCEAEAKADHFALFARYDLDDPDARDRPTYAELAAELGLAPSQVTNYLAATRRAFRRAVLARLRAACGSEEEFRAEARALLGTEIR